MTTLLFMSGSSRIGSVNWELVAAAAALAKRTYGDNITVKTVNLFDYELPNWSGAVVDNAPVPAAVTKLSDTVADSDGIFMGSDEYTGAYSTQLKNAVRWLTQATAEKKRLFDGKPVALCGASIRGVGALRGLPALHQMLTELGAVVYSQHLEIGASPNPFDTEGHFLPKVERQLLQGSLGTLVAEGRQKHERRRSTTTPQNGAAPV